MLCRLGRVAIARRPAARASASAIAAGVVAGGAALLAGGSGADVSRTAHAEQQRSGAVTADLCFASAAEQQACMAEGLVTAKELTLAYIERIKSIDGAGPRLCSVLEVNPEAVQIAEQLDAEREAKGPRGPLHGICVLLKDNVDTGDAMHTTAGSLALLDSVPSAGDATITAKLRASGAIILGKCNLSEWANYRGNSSSGWSGRGGQCKNPHVLDNTPGGSSSGSGSSVAAALAAMAIGSETDGSIVSPSNVNGVCGIKPTVGLVSRAGIVPISADQDTAGPMCRSVTDCAAMLTVIAGPDLTGDPVPPNRPFPAAAIGKDYVAEIQKPGASLKGARIGVLRSKFSGPLRRQPVGCKGYSVRQGMQPTLSKEQSVAMLEDKCLEPLRQAGAVLVDVELWADGEMEAMFPDGLDELRSHYKTTLGYQFVRDIAGYLATRVKNPLVGDGKAGLPKDLKDLALFNILHKEEEMSVFGQERFEDALKLKLDKATYEEVHSKMVEVCGAQGIDKTLKKHNLDALVSPTNGSSFPASIVGYPIVSVPAGTVRGLPFGCAFIGTAFSEARLLQLAYGYEQATHAIVRPQYRETLDLAPPALP